MPPVKPPANRGRKSRGRPSHVGGREKREEQVPAKEHEGTKEKKEKKEKNLHRQRSAETAALSFDFYMTEGNTYMKKEDYKRAINGYTKALEQKPDHKNCLLSRSRCYLQVGDNKSALADANTILKEDSKFIKGIQQKADVLYQMGEFEHALVLYHRGNKIRPEINSFRLGIQLCQGAIDNCIGEKANITLDKSGDLSFFTELQQTKEDGGSMKRSGTLTGRLERETTKVETPHERRRNKSGEKDEKTVKQLLEALYTDKQYLEKLLAETEKVNNKSKTTEQVAELSADCLDYLDTRATFWQQKEPVRDRSQNSQRTWVLENLQWIDEAQSAGQYEKSLERAKTVLRKMKSFSDSDIPQPERSQMEAHLHSYIGNANMELDHLDKALEHHQKDHKLAKEYQLQEALSRSLENQGRVHFRKREYKGAIKKFEERLKMKAGTLEKAYLYHEIGRCYLELGNAEKALKYGEQSLEAANDAGDHDWQLNASILIAQSQVKLKEYSQALDAFERSLELAKCSDDNGEAAEAIEKAIRDVNKQIKMELQGTDEEETESTHEDDDVEKQKAAADDGHVEKAESVEKTETSKPAEEEHVEKPKEKAVEDDKNLGRAQAKEVAEPESSKPVETTYSVSVKLSDVKDAGTVGDVHIQLYGDEEDTGKLHLDQCVNNASKKFAQGTDSEFSLQAADVGQISKAVISSSGKGPGPHVAEVRVKSKSTGKTYVFPCHRWLDKDKEDHQTERELHWIPDTPSGPKISYRVTVRTMDVFGAGTDAKVFLQMFGDGGETDRLILDTSEKNLNKFEQGETDVFLLEAANIGVVRKIRTGHDGALFGSAWMLNDVTVDYEGNSNHFKAERWLDKSKEDGKIEIELLSD